MTDQKNSYTDVKDAIMTIVTGGAVLSGWDAGRAALIGLKAQQAAVARIAAGEQPETALGASVYDAEMILLMDLFARTLAETGEPASALEAVVAFKWKATSDVPGADAAAKVARETFQDAVRNRLAPTAALLSAMISAGAVMRLASVGKH